MNYFYTHTQRKMGSHGESKKSVITVICQVLVYATLQGCFADVTHFRNNTPSRSGDSVVLPLSGKVYPRGSFSVSLNIGRPPDGITFQLDVDTGSDLTWVECGDKCEGCKLPKELRYKPKENNFVHCEDPLCAALAGSARKPCKTPADQCHYEVRYAEGSSTRGVLVKDVISLESADSLLQPLLAFGCGDDQVPPIEPSSGVLGLGKGEVSILSQLVKISTIRNVVGHCLSARGGGFLFIGDDPVPSSGVTWVPMSAGSSPKHYTAGPAELLHDGKPTGVAGLKVVFDSGTTYTSFNPKDYKDLLGQVTADLKGTPLKDAAGIPRLLPTCWKGEKPFKSVNEVKGYFKPLALRFSKGNAQLNLPPETYLIISKDGNVCFGILDSRKEELGELNVIGDISMQDIKVIYDNEKKRIGWVSADCAKIPKP